MPGEAVSPSGDELNHWIAQAAYFRAEKRGFSDGDPVADWLEAEREIEQTAMQANR